MWYGSSLIKDFPKNTFSVKDAALDHGIDMGRKCVGVRSISMVATHSPQKHVALTTMILSFIRPSSPFSPLSCSIFFPASSKWERKA